MIESFPSLTASLVLFVASIIAGLMNALAGGGTFVLFPALILTGAPSIAANATCSIAVWPGTMASAWAYRSEIKGHRDELVPMLALSLIGGLIGSLWFVVISEETFDRVLPWLFLGATLIFIFGKRLSTTFSQGRLFKHLNFRWPIGYGFHFLIALYGGFFGAGTGILILAALSCVGLTDVHKMIGVKALLSSAINFTAVVVFVMSGIVLWSQAFIMILGAVLGGYWGARLALIISPAAVQRIVIATGSIMTVYFFLN